VRWWRSEIVEGIKGGSDKLVVEGSGIGMEWWWKGVLEGEW